MNADTKAWDVSYSKGLRCSTTHPLRPIGMTCASSERAPTYYGRLEMRAIWGVLYWFPMWALFDVLILLFMIAIALLALSFSPIVYDILFYLENYLEDHKRRSRTDGLVMQIPGKYQCSLAIN